MTMRSINPATGETLAEYAAHDDAAVERRLATALDAQREWRDSPLGTRARVLLEAARLLRAQRDDHATRITLEMGKPITQSEAEIDKCAGALEHFANVGEAWLAPERIPGASRPAVVRFDPLGIVLAIMPWNFPYWQAIRAAATALLAGNAMVLKHASNVCGCSLALEALFLEAGAPPGVFASLLLPADRALALVDQAAIAAVTLTGSEAAGAAVAARCGNALKPSVLELGGSDPFIVFADADVAEAARVAVRSRVINSGQSCIAAKRFIVEAAAAPAFERAFLAELARLRVGDPLDPATDVGPLARRDLVEDLDGQVQRSVAAGARLLAGGRAVRGGAFYAPTALAARPGQAAFDEETFGPLAALVTANDESHALELANASRFGLGASLWTRDRDRAERVAARLEAGFVCVNAMVASDARLPFGGVKRSGWGRELGVPGLRAFTAMKTVVHG